MKRVYLAAALPEERSDLHTLLVDLDMQIVGESASWRNVLAMAPATHPEVLVVSWGLIAARSVAALKELRRACPNTSVVVSPGQAEPRQRPAVSSQMEMNDGTNQSRSPLAGRLQAAIESVQSL